MKLNDFSIQLVKYWNRVLEVLPEIVQKLRNMSPLTPKEYRTL